MQTPFAEFLYKCTTFWFESSILEINDQSTPHLLLGKPYH
jgi:hypothetical protein